MMLMAFQSSPIFSLPRARLECSVFRFMRPLGVLRASYYHGGVRREATEAARSREFRSHSRKSSSNANSLCRHVLAEPTGDYHDISNTSFAHRFQSSRPKCPASQSVSNASHMKVAQKPRGTAAAIAPDPFFKPQGQRRFWLSLHKKPATSANDIPRAACCVDV